GGPAALLCRLMLAASVTVAAGAGGALGASAKAPAQKPAAAVAPEKKVTTPTQRCKALEVQFDQALPKHSDGKSQPTAQKLRADGQRLCDAGQHAAGALRLAKALIDLGVRPDDQCRCER